MYNIYARKVCTNCWQVEATLNSWVIECVYVNGSPEEMEAAKAKLEAKYNKR